MDDEVTMMFVSQKDLDNIKKKERARIVAILEKWQKNIKHIKAMNELHKQSGINLIDTILREVKEIEWVKE